MSIQMSIRQETYVQLVSLGCTLNEEEYNAIRPIDSHTILPQFRRDNVWKMCSWNL